MSWTTNGLVHKKKPRTQITFSRQCRTFQHFPGPVPIGVSKYKRSLFYLRAALDNCWAMPVSLPVSEEGLSLRIDSESSLEGTIQDFKDCMVSAYERKLEVGNYKSYYARIRDVLKGQGEHGITMPLIDIKKVRVWSEFHKTNKATKKKDYDVIYKYIEHKERNGGVASSTEEEIKLTFGV